MELDALAQVQLELGEIAADVPALGQHWLGLELLIVIDEPVIGEKRDVDGGLGDLVPSTVPRSPIMPTFRVPPGFGCPAATPGWVGCAAGTAVGAGAGADVGAIEVGAGLAAAGGGVGAGAAGAAGPQPASSETPAADNARRNAWRRVRPVWNKRAMQARS